MKIKLILMVGLILLTSCSQKPGNYDMFAQCLTQRGVKMYGTEWCSHCQNQKAAFGNSFQYIDYVDCGKSNLQCLEAGVSGYPTWVINNTKYPGEQKLQRLSALTGCNIGN